MKAGNLFFVFVLLWACFAQAETQLSELIQAPRAFSIGMTEKELADQNEGLFPGPPIRQEGDDVAFKTFMEVEGMGSPGHRSFYYLFENDALQGVIQTASLLGLDQESAMRISGSNYKRVLEAVSGQPVKSEILRKDGESFANVTLEKWSLDDPSIDVFHVATNYESSVGVLASGTRFPTGQLFVSAEDSRFRGQILDDATIVDTSRVELQNTAGLRLDRRHREGRDLEPFGSEERERVVESHEDPRLAEGAETENEDALRYWLWGLLVIAGLGCLYVFFKVRPGSG